MGALPRAAKDEATKAFGLECKRSAQTTERRYTIFAEVDMARETPKRRGDEPMKRWLALQTVLVS